MQDMVPEGGGPRIFDYIVIDRRALRQYVRLQDELRRYNTLVQAIREVVDNESQAQEVALSDHAGNHQRLADPTTATKPLRTMEQHIRKTANLVEKLMLDRLQTK